MKNFFFFVSPLIALYIMNSCSKFAILKKVAVVFWACPDSSFKNLVAAPTSVNLSKLHVQHELWVVVMTLFFIVHFAISSVFCIPPLFFYLSCKRDPYSSVIWTYSLISSFLLITIYFSKLHYPSLTQTVIPSLEGIHSSPTSPLFFPFFISPHFCYPFLVSPLTCPCFISLLWLPLKSPIFTICFQLGLPLLHPSFHTFNNFSRSMPINLHIYSVRDLSLVNSLTHV